MLQSSQYDRNWKQRQKTRISGDDVSQETTFEQWTSRQFSEINQTLWSRTVDTQSQRHTQAREYSSQDPRHLTTNLFFSFSSFCQKHLLLVWLSPFLFLFLTPLLSKAPLPWPLVPPPPFPAALLLLLFQGLLSREREKKGQKKKEKKNVTIINIFSSAPEGRKKMESVISLTSFKSFKSFTGFN